ncbi:MAG TPA: NADH-quinone oxidoreductase subunit C [Thermoleophilaceae bacterium]|nr:NADH-quinone oxidoreductase subunit C [Thermoleophilaceae bacterium]
MPDATGLELIAQRVRDRLGDEAVTDTVFFRGEATLEVAPAAVRDTLAYLRDEDDEPWTALMSVHGCDYLPEEPRLGVHYQLLSMERTDRLNVKTRLGADDPRLPTIVDLFPTADYQEREVYDMFGVVFEGHPDPRRILMPEDYEGFPQRRDFPMGGEPVLYTFNEGSYPRWYD